MNKATIICISAWKGSGKDTVANYLSDKYGVTRLGFADPLKDMVSELFGIKRNAMDLPHLKEQPIMYMPVAAKDGFSETVTTFMQKEFKKGEVFDPTKYWTPRALCILVGSCMRSVNPNFWVEKAVAKTEPGKVYAIADCRYRNEIEAIKATGANVISVRINRFETSPSVDPSERDLDDYKFDRVIENKGTLEELYAAVNMAIVEGLKQ